MALPLQQVRNGGIAVQPPPLAMRAAGNPPEVFRYAGDHAFFNERRADVYDADAAGLAWERMVTFLYKHLR